MKSAVIAILAGWAARASAHATFQILYVDGVNYITQCARLPASNSPVTDVLSNDIACNAGSSSAAAKCAVKAGSTVTVEMHQQPNTKDCASEAIGGAHYGPVQVYLAKVSDASTAVGSSAGWFKIFADTWAKNTAGTSGDADFWGTKDLTTCCGRMNIKIPSDIAPGDYLLRAEALALHTAGSSGGAQFYMTCYQITVTGGGSASPATVKLPGAYAAADPGILVDIHAKMSTYIAPGPTVYSGGSTKSAGAPCAACESTCAATQASGTAVRPSTTAVPTTLTTSAAPGTTTSASSGGGGANCAAKYAQCGGQGWKGATCCQSGSTCSTTNPVIIISHSLRVGG
ncbi:glycosylhydrolase family 61-5 [Diaporthe helianthi]|uniref:lytic cellulose monooxygenase (C4-dehydrogenating) n=1 Tax=Diaporthe helianthi TaxID=158607 RepID=A0A2P5I833_DIAHE|nr:glycosylhydrolase family 61-5 [Diaporthe helianthi]